MRWLSFVVAVVAALGAGDMAQAQNYPNRGPSRLVVPYPPGGGVDAMARDRRREAFRCARPAGGRRQPRRRLRPGRHAFVHQERARRLHAVPRPYRLDLDQSEPLRQCGLRSAQGLRADRPDRLDAGRAARASIVPGKDHRGRGDDRQEGRRQVQHRHLGGRARAAICRPNCSSRSPASMPRSFPTRAPGR